MNSFKINNSKLRTSGTSPSHIALSVPLLILISCFCTLYFHVILQLIRDWLTNSNYSHGFLVPFISGYIIWQRRTKLSALKIQPSNIGLILLLIGLGIFIVGTIGAELFTVRFSIIVTLCALVIYLLGVEHGKLMAVPIGYLIFMIPLPAIVWNKLAFPLKLFVTKLAVSLVSLTKIPAFREGNIIHLTNTDLQVIDACSGMRSLTSLLALSAAFALISNLSTTKKWIMFLSAFPIAIVLNIIRLFITAILAQYYGPGIAQGFLHELSGIFIFLVAIFCLYIFHSFLKRISLSSVRA